MLGHQARQSADKDCLSRYLEVMTTAPQFLTVEEFDKLYGSESGWEDGMERGAQACA